MFTKALLVNRLHDNQVFNTEFKVFIKDKNYPLEERWDLFKFAAINHLFVNPSSFYIDLEILETKSNFSWYDNLYISEGSDIDLVVVVEHFEDELKKDWEKLNWVLKTQEEVAELKESILSQGYTSFYYD